MRAWSAAELGVLAEHHRSPRAVLEPLLPGRTWQTIRGKRWQIGLAGPAAGRPRTRPIEQARLRVNRYVEAAHRYFAALARGRFPEFSEGGEPS